MKALGLYPSVLTTDCVPWAGSVGHQGQYKGARGDGTWTLKLLQQIPRALLYADDCYALCVEALEGDLIPLEECCFHLLSYLHCIYNRAYSGKPLSVCRGRKVISVKAQFFSFTVQI